MNESLRRALLKAGLSEEDVAACLEVDPKTVRRWLEGRMPYLRHRWALSGLVGVDEADLWPQLRAAGSVPAEVQAIYPHLGAVPRDLWLRLFGSAERKIDILARDEDPVLEDPQVQDVLASKARAGIAVRICLVVTRPADTAAGRDRGPERTRTAGRRPTLAEALSGSGGYMEVRRRNGPLYAAVYHADDEVLVGQRAYGIPHAQAPVLHLRGADGGPMAAAYRDSFERFWAGQQPHR